MCSSCGKSNSQNRIQQRLYTAVKGSDPENCTVTKEDVLLIHTRLLCFKNKFPNHPDINSYLGVVESLLNTEQYCLFDLTTIIESLDGSTC